MDKSVQAIIKAMAVVARELEAIGTADYNAGNLRGAILAARLLSEKWALHESMLLALFETEAGDAARGSR